MVVFSLAYFIGLSFFTNVELPTKHHMVMRVNDELGRMWKEAVMTHFRIQAFAKSEPEEQNLILGHQSSR
jgi:hypothetical protein